MKTENLVERQISDEAYAWYLKYLQTIDDKDIHAYGGFLAETCTMIQNNQDPVIGKKAILAGLAQYWTSFKSVTHELLNLRERRRLRARSVNHYTRLDGGKVSVRAVALTDRNAQGMVKQFRFYTDVSPVFKK